MASLFENAQARVMRITSRNTQEKERDTEADATSDTSTPVPPPPVDPSQYGPITVTDKLSHFRVLMGIHSAAAFSTLTILQRPAPNLGIYARTVHAEARARLQFHIFAVLINGGLGLQIIVAAALTALGASNGSHTAVTAFGAINTVIAGFLTFMKGSGLPNRMKYYQNEWSKVREYIEQRERDLALDSCKLDVENEVRIVEAMYEAVREDIEANTPDSYTSAGSKKHKDIAPGPTIAKTDAMKSEKAKKENEVEEIPMHGENGVTSSRSMRSRNDWRV